MATAVLAGCNADEVDLADRECPCVQGWMCDDQTNVCVEVGSHDATVDHDAALFDAAIVDAALVTDAGNTDAPWLDAAIADASPPTDASDSDASDSDASDSDASNSDAQVSDANVDCVKLVINEIVIWAQQDWDDSAGGDGIEFNAIPGSGAFDNSSDEWVELFNVGCAVDLTGYTISFVDATGNTYEFGAAAGGQVLKFSAGGSVNNFQAGEYLVIGNPGVGPGSSSQVTSNAWIHLDDPAGVVIDEVALGTSTGGDGNPTNNAPSGASSDTSDESRSRVPNGADTDVDSDDWISTTATIGAAN